MPHNPIDYSKTIMYKIVCNDLEIKDCYVGHTTDFKSRKNQHKYNYNNEKNKSYNFKVYQFIRDNGGWNNWSMIMIEEYNCNNRLEATKRERELIEELQSNLNYNIPARTNKEYYKENLDKIREYKKEYCEQNIEKLKEYKKKYSEQNIEKLKEYKKKYNKDNKDKILEKFKCECGGCYTYSNKAIHLKTKKHQEYLLKVSIPEQNTT